MSEHDDARNERLLNLMDGLARSIHSDVEGAEEELREQGEDPDALRKRGVAFVREVRGQSKLEAAREERLKREEQAESRREQIKRQLREMGRSAEELLRELAADREGELSLSFRKIESLGDEDAIDALTDAEILRLWDKVEEKD